MSRGDRSQVTPELRLALPMAPRAWAGPAASGLIALAIGVAGVASGATRWAVTGLLVFVVLVALFLPGVIQRSRPLVLRGGVLTLPRWPLGVRRVPVSTICGIGLLRIQIQLSTGWRLHYWVDGQDRPLDGILTDTGQLDAAAPQRSPLGAAATQLYRTVLAIQGQAGPLAMQQAQRRPPQRFGAVRVLASWSPDE